MAAPSPIPPVLGARAITLANASQITQTREITGVVLGPVAYSPDGKTLAVGISNLIDLRDGRPVHQVPALLWTPGGMDMKGVGR